MKFLNEKYDDKNHQLYFYPKVSKTLATKNGRFWKDKDDSIGS